MQSQRFQGSFQATSHRQIQPVQGSNAPVARQQAQQDAKFSARQAPRDIQIPELIQSQIKLLLETYPTGIDLMQFNYAYQRMWHTNFTYHQQHGMSLSNFLLSLPGLEGGYDHNGQAIVRLRQGSSAMTVQITPSGSREVSLRSTVTNASQMGTVTFSVTTAAATSASARFIVTNASSVKTTIAPKPTASSFLDAVSPLTAPTATITSTTRPTASVTTGAQPNTNLFPTKRIRRNDNLMDSFGSNSTSSISSIAQSQPVLGLQSATSVRANSGPKLTQSFRSTAQPAGSVAVAGPSFGANRFDKRLSASGPTAISSNNTTASGNRVEYRQSLDSSFSDDESDDDNSDSSDEEGESITKQLHDIELGHQARITREYRVKTYRLLKKLEHKYPNGIE